MNNFWLNIKIGLRYISAKRRDGFISVMSLISFLGIALGVMALIVVISVMNGFEKDLTEKMLSMASHATISSPNGRFENWEGTLNKSLEHEEVVGAAPYVEGQAMVSTGSGATGILVRGIDQNMESDVSDIVGNIIGGSIESLEPGKFNIVIGYGLAMKFGLKVGEKLTLIVPQSDASIMGFMPRLKRFTISGIFKIGMNDYDSQLVLTDLQDAAVLYKIPGSVSGVRLKVKDMFQARNISEEVAREIDSYLVITDWSENNPNFFKAVATEKTIMFIIMSLIVMVASFNIVATMVMAVNDKESEIAILRTLGIIPKGIMQIFMTQGMVIGFVGTLIGVFFGSIIASNIDVIVPFIESVLGRRFLDPSIYMIDEVPSVLVASDVVYISVMSFVMSFVATIYPAYKASKTQPAEALRYE